MAKNLRVVYSLEGVDLDQEITGTITVTGTVRRDCGSPPQEVTTTLRVSNSVAEIIAFATKDRWIAAQGKLRSARDDEALETLARTGFEFGKPSLSGVSEVSDEALIAELERRGLIK